jgi:hypothetical protein
MKTVDDEPELVAEFGGEGAEDPAGPEIEVEQPWEGYPALTAADIVDRLAGAPAEVLTAVLLYEPHHRNRRTVMAAAEARLVALENTPSASPR